MKKNNFPLFVIAILFLPLFALCSSLDSENKQLNNSELIGVWSMIKYNDDSHIQNINCGDVIWNITTSQKMEVNISYNFSKYYNVKPIKFNGDYSFVLKDAKIEFADVTYNYKIENNILIVFGEIEGNPFNATFTKEMTCEDINQKLTSDQIIGEWVMVKVIGWKIRELELKDRTIIYKFKENGVLEVLNTSEYGYKSGIYQYQLGFSNFYSSYYKVLGVQVDQSSKPLSCSFYKNTMRIGLGYIDGHDFEFEKK